MPSVRVRACAHVSRGTRQPNWIELLTLHTSTEAAFCSRTTESRATACVSRRSERAHEAAAPRRWRRCSFSWLCFVRNFPFSLRFNHSYCLFSAPIKSCDNIGGGRVLVAPLTNFSRNGWFHVDFDFRFDSLLWVVLKSLLNIPLITLETLIVCLCNTSRSQCCRLFFYMLADWISCTVFWS